MPKVSIVAKNYAKALFRAAKESNIIDQISENLETFKKSFSMNFAHELKNPAIASADSVQIITEITTKLKLPKLLANFLAEMSRNRRLALFPEIYQEFSHLVKIEKNILEIELISTSNLENSIIDEIKNVINKKYPNKMIEFKQTIKQDILGGIQIKINSDLIDASLKNKLANVKKELIAAAK